MTDQLIANRYRTEKFLARVNHSDFYEGIDAQQQTPVIIRLLHLDEKDAEEKLHGFMENEMRLMAQLTHPNILRTLDYGVDATIYFTVHEHVPFQTLAQLVAEKGRLDLATALRFTLELADILSHLHHIGIIHCDIKPENALVIKASVKLIEFNIANHILKGDRMTTGTPAYMSPEAVRGAAPAVTRDVWALGITLFELIAGHLPYTRPTDLPPERAVPILFNTILLDPVPAIEAVVPNLPPRLISLLHWMLEKDPQKRIGSMRTVAAELEAVLTGLRSDSVALITGDVINGRFRLQTNIAEGAFAQVFRAADLQTGETVAVKRLKAEVASNTAHVARFRRESKALEQLDHPNIIRIRDTIEIGNAYYIVMDYVAGGDLRAYLQQRKLPLPAFLKIAQGLSQALIRAHDLNIIHRDIKPDNILISDDGTPHLSDFGLARIDNATFLTETGAVMGTIHYIAPEVIESKGATKQSDIWSLGIVFYEMLIGATPFGDGSATQVIFAILNAPIPSLPETFPEPLTALITSMLQRDPANRIASMSDVSQRLMQIASQA